tara:strand:+ start:15 stop:188 length:174 start_codon:yes stop_codon:yes gene_type:complete
MNKTIKLTSTMNGKTIKFKPYQIGSIPNSFNKYKDLYFNKGGITYIEEKTHWSDALK